MKSIIILIFFTCCIRHTVAGQNKSQLAVNLIHENVPLIPQPASMSCWVTAAAMVISWRDQSSTSPENIVRGQGKWENYFNANTGLPVSELGFGTAREFFAQLGLTPLPNQCYSVDGFEDHLAKGPMWIAGPGHAVVVTGISGDGTPENTYVYINDPWDTSNANLPSLSPEGFKAQNTGQYRIETFREFSLNMEQTAAEVISKLEEKKGEGVITDQQISEFYSKDFYGAN